MRLKQAGRSTRSVTRRGGISMIVEYSNYFQARPGVVEGEKGSLKE